MTIGLPVTSARRTLIVLSALGIAAAGCSPPEPDLVAGILSFQDLEEPLCASADRLLSGEIARIEQAVGLEFREPVTVFTEDVEERCVEATLPLDVFEGAQGCALSGTRVASGLDVLSHELVHALRLQHDIVGTPFFEEGLASSLGDRRPLGIRTIELDPPASPTQPEDAASVPWGEHTYQDLQTGTHFVAWLRETHVAELLTFSSQAYDATSVVQVFEDAFGVSLPETAEMWRSDAPNSYRLSSFCAGRDSLEANEIIEVVGQASCADPTTEALGPESLFAGRVCFEVVEETPYVVSLSAEDGVLLLEPLSCELPARATVEAGSTRELTLAPCTWMAVFSVTSGPQDFTFTIEPTP